MPNKDCPMKKVYSTKEILEIFEYSPKTNIKDTWFYKNGSYVKNVGKNKWMFKRPFWLDEEDITNRMNN